MLVLTIDDFELYDERNEEFLTFKGQTLKLEHSLVSMSKWEARWQIPFLTKEEKTREQTIDYIKFMTITQNVDEIIFVQIYNSYMPIVKQYIEHPMTATTFSKKDGPLINREIITSEVIYYWMVALAIPFECQRWHLNRLLTLINVCNIKNQPKKKMNHKQLMTRNKALNEARLRELNTTG